MYRFRDRILCLTSHFFSFSIWLTTVWIAYFSHRLHQVRNKYKDAFAEKHGTKLGFMSFFVKGAAAALRSQPDINAVIDGKDIVYRDYVDISVAVATPTGLVIGV